MYYSLGALLTPGHENPNQNDTTFLKLNLGSNPHHNHAWGKRVFRINDAIANFYNKISSWISNIYKIESKT